MGMDYIETSAKDSVNVVESFERITLKMIEKFGKEVEPIPSEEYIEPVEEKKKCCWCDFILFKIIQYLIFKNIKRSEERR